MERFNGEQFWFLGIYIEKYNFENCQVAPCLKCSLHNVSYCGDIKSPIYKKKMLYMDYCRKCFYVKI